MNNNTTQEETVDLERVAPCEVNVKDGGTGKMVECPNKGRLYFNTIVGGEIVKCSYHREPDVDIPVDR